MSIQNGKRLSVTSTTGHSLVELMTNKEFDDDSDAVGQMLANIDVTSFTTPGRSEKYYGHRMFSVRNVNTKPVPTIEADESGNSVSFFIGTDGPIEDSMICLWKAELKTNWQD